MQFLGMQAMLDRTTGRQTYEAKIKMDIYNTINNNTGVANGGRNVSVATRGRYRVAMSSIPRDKKIVSDPQSLISDTRLTLAP